jgi:hypothetical protein
MTFKQRKDGVFTVLEVLGMQRVVVSHGASEEMRQLAEEFERWLDGEQEEYEREVERKLAEVAKDFGYKVDRKLKELVDKVFRGRSAEVKREEGSFTLTIHRTGGTDAVVFGNGTPDWPEDLCVWG